MRFKYRYLIIIVTLLCPCAIAAQTDNSMEVMKEINAIKRDTTFLHATGTSTVSAADALDNAKELLNVEIEAWLKDNQCVEVAGYIAKARQHVAELQTRKGNLFRAFAFVNKRNVLPLMADDKVIMSDTAHASVLTSVLVAPISKSDSVSAAVDSVSIHEIGSQKETQLENIVESQFVLSEVEREMLLIHSFSDLQSYIKGKRDSGILVSYGKYKDRPSSGNFHMIVYDKEGSIPAHLRVIDNIVYNLSTASQDSMTNYEGCGAIWFQLKK